MIRYLNVFIALQLIMLSGIPANGQDTLNKHGLAVIYSLGGYKATIDRPGKSMADIKKHIPGIVIDLKYTGTDNFMRTPLYTATTTTYLRIDAIERLKSVQSALEEIGLGLKIWDGYRPYSVTEKMWETVKDDRYAADPKTGSGHNRGIAVDVTLIKKRNKKELDMGTGFDNFSDTAHHNFRQLSAEAATDRILLRSLMEKHGFKALETEWWHYYLPATQDYELLNLSFNDLKALNW